MTDDTRDIAITALEQGKSAHKRLDTINGQIRRLGESHEGMREDFNAANLALVERVTEISTTLRTTLKVAAALSALAISITGGVAVYTLTHPRHVSPPPAQAAPQHPH